MAVGMEDSVAAQSDDAVVRDAIASFGAPN